MTATTSRPRPRGQLGDQQPEAQPERTVFADVGLHAVPFVAALLLARSLGVLRLTVATPGVYPDFYMFGLALYVSVSIVSIWRVCLVLLSGLTGGRGPIHLGVHRPATALWLWLGIPAAAGLVILAVAVQAEMVLLQTPTAEDNRHATLLLYLYGAAQSIGVLQACLEFDLGRASHPGHLFAQSARLVSGLVASIIVPLGIFVVTALFTWGMIGYDFVTFVLADLPLLVCLVVAVWRLLPQYRKYLQYSEGHAPGESALVRTPKRVMPVLLIPVHVVPIAAFIAVGWWYGHASPPRKSDPFLAVILLYGLPSVVCLWRIVVVSLAATVVEGGWLQRKNLTIQFWTLTKPGGKALEVALWVGAPAAFGLHILRHAPAVPGVLQAAELPPTSMAYSLLALLVGMLAQQTRVCADALEFAGATGTTGSSRIAARPIAFLTWAVWLVLPASIWWFAMIVSFGDLALKSSVLDLTMLCLLAYSAARLTLCLREIPSVHYERGTPS